MDNFKKELEDRLPILEANIKLYDKFVTNKDNPEDDRKIISFKLFFELVSFQSLLEYFPDYQPGKETVFLMAGAFKGMNDFVQVKDGKIEISPAYYELLKRKEEFLNKAKSN